MSKLLFVAWRSGGGGDSQWGPVARVDNELGHYRFAYTKGAKLLKGFSPFPGMPNLGEVYESDELLPIFQSRLLSRSRPEYRDFLAWSGFNPDSPPEPLELLGVTEGLRATDLLELFPCPAPDSMNCFNIKFFLHGVRHMPAETQKEIGLLRREESLGLMFDVSNWNDCHAVAIRTCPDRKRLLIGYMPRYLARDTKALFGSVSTGEIKVTVERVNPDAPMQQRLLCRMEAPWPQSYSPCKGEEFQPFVGALPCPV
jgi:hypothetical protein